MPSRGKGCHPDREVPSREGETGLRGGPLEYHEAQHSQGPACELGQSQAQLENNGVESRSEEKNMVLLIDENLNMAQIAAQKAKHMLSCIKKSVASSTFASLWQDPTWSTALGSGVSNKRRMWTCWSMAR